MRANSFNTGIASEYLILSKLYRLDLEAYISQGNKKSVDIRVIRKDDTPVSIDVKSVRGYSSLVINNVEPKHNHFLVFVIYNNKFEDLKIEPDIFIIPSIELFNADLKLTETYGNEKRVLKGKLKDYKNKWEYISDGYGEDPCWGDKDWEWDSFFSCHENIRDGEPIIRALKEYNIYPNRFIELQQKLPPNLHISNEVLDNAIFESYSTEELEVLCATIKSQNIKGETEKLGKRVEKELKRRNTIA